MKVKELIEHLQKVDGELTVIVQADHGQSAMKATWAGESKVENIDDYMGETIHEGDLPDYPDAVPVFEIQAF